MGNTVLDSTRLDSTINEHGTREQKMESFTMKLKTMIQTNV